MMDPTVAIYVAIALGVVFCLGLLVPRRPREVLSSHTDAELKAINLRLNELEKKQDLNDHDVRGIRMVMQHMPTIKSVHDLELKVTEIGGKVEGVSTQIASISSTTVRIADFLMNATAEAIASRITEDRK